MGPPGAPPGAPGSAQGPPGDPSGRRSVRFWCPLNLARNPNPHMKMRIRTLRWQCVFDLGSFVGHRPMHVQDCVAHGAVLSQSDTFVLVLKPERQALTDNEADET